MLINVVADFGADPTGTDDRLARDSLDAFNAAVASFGRHDRQLILIPPGDYYLSDTWVIDRPVAVFGGGVRHGHGTTLRVRKGRDGIRVLYQGTIPGGGAGSILENFKIIPTGGTPSWVPNTRGYVENQSVVVPSSGYAGFAYVCVRSGNSGDEEPVWPTVEGATIDDPRGTCAWQAVYIAGVKLLGSAELKNIFSSGFGGDGFSVFASTGDGNNANSWLMQRCMSTGNAGWGFFTQGADSNGGLAINCISQQNGIGGYQDHSFLGNSYVACLAEGNVTYGYLVDQSRPTNMSGFFNCYTEAGQINRIHGRAMWFGGIKDPRVSIYGTGNIITQESNTLYFLNDNNNDGTGDSAYIRIGRIATQDVLEMGFSQNAGGINVPISLGYGVVNGSGIPGWVGWAENSRSAWAMSIGNAAEGGGHFWIPNDYYFGPHVTLRSRHVSKSIGPPSAGAFSISDFCQELSLQETGAYGFSCVTAGTPGVWGIIQPKPTRSVSTDSSTSPLDFYIGVTNLDTDRIITLPNGSNLADGFEMVIKDETGQAGRPHEIRVTPAGDENLDGNNTYIAIRNRYGKLRVIRRNSAWWTI